MNEQDQRIAIAKALGELNPRDDGNGGVIASSWCHRGVYGGTHGVPNYPRDLNAMHEAEDALISDPDLEYKYGETLARMTIGPERDEKGFAPNGWGYFAVARATAAQRAEALLRTLNLWKP